MLNWKRFLDWLTGRSVSDEATRDRRARREAARQRHRESGAPPWADDDLVPGPGGTRPVADVSPGTPGAFGSNRTIRDD